MILFPLVRLGRFAYDRWAEEEVLWGIIVFKWVVGLCAAMYVTLLIFGEPPEGEAVAAVIEQPRAAEPVDVIAPAPAKKTKPMPLVETVTTVALNTAKEKLVIENLKPVKLDNPLAPLATPVANPESTAAPQLTTEAEVEASVDDRGIGEIWRVTGSAVNLRAGATTQAAVLGKTRRGDSAEMIELLDNGWARVYILENGQEAYMSAKFLKRDIQ